MLFLISLLLTIGFSFLCGKPLKKCPHIFYALAVAITIATVIISGLNTHGLPTFITNYVLAIFTRGSFATALWCVVMWVGAMPNGSVPIKKIMPIRGELSILTAILTLGHNIGFGRTYFVRLFTDSSKMTSNQITASILTIIMLIIMIPLTVMSIPQIRRKMNPKLWKKIQRTAYIFYALIYIHVMVLCYPMAKAGRDGYLFSIFVYSVIFIGYAVCRLRKWYILRKKPDNTMLLNIISIIIFTVLVLTVVLCARTSKNNISDKSVNSSTSDIQTAVTSATSVLSETITVQTSTTTVSVSSTSNQTQTTALTTTSLYDTGTTTEISLTTTVSTDITENIEVSEDNIENVDVNIDDEINTDDNNTEQDNYQEVIEQTNQSVYQPEEIETPSEEPSPVYIYNNGTYSASAYGYDGDVYVTITIENDTITSISAYTDESDPWYFESAEGSVISQIISSQSTSVDAVSGATYSSNAIMSAVQQALNSARI